MNYNDLANLVGDGFDITSERFILLAAAKTKSSDVVLDLIKKIEVEKKLSFDEQLFLIISAADNSRDWGVLPDALKHTGFDLNTVFKDRQNLLEVLVRAQASSYCVGRLINVGAPYNRLSLLKIAESCQNEEAIKLLSSVSYNYF